MNRTKWRSAVCRLDRVLKMPRSVRNRPALLGAAAAEVVRLLRSLGDDDSWQGDLWMALVHDRMLLADRRDQRALAGIYLATHRWLHPCDCHGVCPGSWKRMKAQ